MECKQWLVQLGGEAKSSKKAEFGFRSRLGLEIIQNF